MITISDHNTTDMAQLHERLVRFEQERKEIHEKMIPLKNELKPLSKRLMQVSRNINVLKYNIRNIEI